MSFRYYNPVCIRFGLGALDELPRLVGEGPAGLVIFPEARSLGLLERVEKFLGQRLISTVEDVPSNPTRSWLANRYGTFDALRQQRGVVVALGGGSVLDSAKVLAVLTEDGSFGSIERHLREGSRDGILGHLRMIALPTTAGTGSEVTPWATVWDPDEGRGTKYSLHLPSSWFDTAVIDPELGRSLPAAVMRNAALDALSHSLEAIWNVNANPISDGLALRAARTIIAALPEALRDPSEMPARIRLADGALLAGLAFSNTQTALAHALSYPMTLEHGLPHGLACSFTLPRVWALALGRDAGRDALLAQVFDGPSAEGPSRLSEFLEGLGVSTAFASYGITEAQAETWLASARSGPRGRNFIARA